MTKELAECLFEEDMTLIFTLKQLWQVEVMGYNLSTVGLVLARKSPVPADNIPRANLLQVGVPFKISMHIVSVVGVAVAQQVIC